MISKNNHQEDDLRDEPSPTAGAGVVPWEKRYEKLWVEVEKHHVKSSYKNVAHELKEKFGELLRPEAPAAEEEEWDEPVEDSSNEGEEGEVIVPPGASYSIPLTIPEQTDPRLKDAESPERSTCEDRRQVQEQQSGNFPDPDLSNHQESRKPSSTHRTNSLHGLSRTPTNHQTGFYSKFQPHKTAVLQQDVFWKHNAAGLVENNRRDPVDAEGYTKSQPPSLISHAAPTKGASLEGMEEKKEEVEEERFKLNVATPKVVPRDFEKENSGLQQEVEEAVCPIIS